MMDGTMGVTQERKKEGQKERRRKGTKVKRKM